MAHPYSMGSKTNNQPIGGIMPKKQSLFIIHYSDATEIKHTGTLKSAKSHATKNAPIGCDIRIYEGKMQIRSQKYAVKGPKSKKYKLTPWKDSRC